MNQGGTFDKLVAGLSLDERRELLSKLSAQNEYSRDPLFKEEEVPAVVDIQRRYKDVPWYTQFFLFILSIIKSKPPMKVFEDRLIAKLGSSIDTAAPGLYDYRRGMLLPVFLDELKSLKEGARFFYEALDSSVGRDKGSFFSFLASLELDFVHRRIGVECNPRNIADGNTAIGEAELRQTMFRILDDVLQSIDELQRKTMYRNARSLHYLRELSSFLFDRLMSAFSPEPSLDGPACPSYLVLDQLLALNNILYSLQETPSLALLESLFVFQLQDRMGEDGFDVTMETRALLVRAEESLSRIRHFNRRVPFTSIIRCASRDLAYLPQVVSGGEDWFAVYKDHWKKSLEDSYSSYIRERRRLELADTFAKYLKGISMKPLEYAASQSDPEGIAVRNGFALSFLAAFYKAVFLEELNRVLKPILIDGEFYKRENRAEFTEAYNELLKIGDAVHGFDMKLSPAGEYGKRYALAKGEMSALAVKRRKLQVLAQEAADDAAGIVNRATAALRSMVNILGGILKGEAGGKYDSLANLSSLSGKAGTFIPSLNAALQKIEKGIQLLAEIESLESGR